jgi:hypothetical protein
MLKDAQGCSRMLKDAQGCSRMLKDAQLKTKSYSICFGSIVSKAMHLKTSNAFKDQQCI